MFSSAVIMYRLCKESVKLKYSAGWIVEHGSMNDPAGWHFCKIFRDRNTVDSLDGCAEKAATGAGEIRNAHDLLAPGRRKSSHVVLARQGSRTRHPGSWTFGQQCSGSAGHPKSGRLLSSEPAGQTCPPGQFIALWQDMMCNFANTCPLSRCVTAKLQNLRRGQDNKPITRLSH